MQDYLAAATGVVVATLVTGMLWLAWRRASRPRTHDGPTGQSVAFLFRRGRLVDASPEASGLLGHDDLSDIQWADLHRALVPMFPDLPETPPTGASGHVCAFEPGLRLDTLSRGQTLRLTLSAPALCPVRALQRIDRAQTHARLEAILDNAPVAAWLTDAAGRNIWANRTYTDLAGPLARDDTPLFDLPDLSDTATFATRASLPDGAGGQRWFEVITHPSDGGRLYYARDIGDLVSAEMAQRNFVQTLSKTFAHLPIGLAVFDRDRRLALFNPALLDLTRLQADFLSTRPSLPSFLDQLRERRMMPEPKNYVSWREKLNDMVDAARDDRFCETWSLGSGLTYKVTGRPHPDGAVAFLFEDISAEISLTRRFRAELDLTRSVIDSIGDAVVVFSQMGVLSFCNSAYLDMWGNGAATSAQEANILDATRQWQAACKPDPIWAEIREFVLTRRNRAPREAHLAFLSGEPLLCRIEPLSGGATLLRFVTDMPGDTPSDTDGSDLPRAVGRD